MPVTTVVTTEPLHVFYYIVGPTDRSPFIIVLGVYYRLSTLSLKGVPQSKRIAQP